MSKAWFTHSSSFTLTTFLQALSGLLSAKFLVDHGLHEVSSSTLKNASRLLSNSSQKEWEVWLCVLPAFAPRLSPRMFLSDKSQKILAERKP